MIGVIIVVHVVACILLIALILIQTGHGGGLVDAFSDVESMFGTKTNVFLSRTTAALSALFLITCLSLAFLSARQSRSLMRENKAKQATQEAAKEQTPFTPELPKDQQAAPVQSQ